MTRINAGINPKRLTNEHLLAEHREIKRVCELYYRRCLKKKQGGRLSLAPTEFTLGKGHVLFFVEKPIYTLQRYIRIRDECTNRGFNVTDFQDAWKVYFSGEFKMNFPVHTRNIKNYPVEYLPAKAHIDNKSISRKDALGWPTLKKFVFLF